MPPSYSGRICSPFPRGVNSAFWRTPPKTTCFEELLPRISSKALEPALNAWVQDGLELSLEAEIQAVSIDGKTLRGTLTAHQKAVHLLAPLDHKLG
ncbi:MAG: hypothetical protein KDA84_07340 [Planctomycetaceae bacterium]|nr:hypothetical protein [Planctomycetaceae bacterium]